MPRTIFSIVSFVVSVYALLCFLRILLTWVPALSYSRFSRFLGKVCDPYLNVFRGIKWLRLGSFDFSAALGLCILGVLATMLSNFAGRSTITLGFVGQMILQLAWSVITSIITFLIIILAVRLIVLFVRKGQYYSSPILDQIDASISPLVYNIARTFTAGKKVSYTTALVIAIIALAAIIVLGSIAVWLISGILAGIS
ncbi:MAG: YggT family protein [Treponema sp.]|jgi:YggT family protein|nr:YggT family protein [Treponema sp.]MBQ1644765.1 YggT family protein [Treponema sp.]MBQ1713388.1 YggT family protein [Treponema sp.]MBQ1727596.1 YggT family protein [Treponema sp.]MBQ1794853.1 YggT family protein [Treponema sp.]